MRWCRESNLEEALEEIVERIIRLERKVHTMSENQAHLDQVTSKLSAAQAEIRKEIDDLRNQPGAEALDFSGVDSAAEGLTAIGAEDDVPPAPAPAPEPAPVEPPPAG